MDPSYITDGPYDCRTCGACCVVAGPVTVAPTDVQVPRNRTRSVRRMIGFCSFDADDGVRAMKSHDDGRCHALKGDPGISVSCAIYDRRPAVCAAFEPGGDLCREARSNARSRLSTAGPAPTGEHGALPSEDPFPIPAISNGRAAMTRTLVER